MSKNHHLSFLVPDSGQPDIPELAAQGVKEPASLFSGPGNVRACLRTLDWSASVLGAPHTWPAAIRTVVRLMLDSTYPMFVFWGPQLGLLYNDPYVEFLREKHPGALGSPFQKVWRELWPQLSPLIARALAGEPVYIEDMPLVIRRGGRNEQTWFTFSYSPIYDDNGKIVGLYGTGIDTTKRVLTERRLSFQLRMADQLRGLTDPYEVARRASRLLGEELGVSRVLFGEIIDGGEQGLFHSNYTDGSVPELLGPFKPDDYGSAVFAKLRAGKTSIHDNLPAELGSIQPEAASNFKAVNTEAEISVPVLRDGKLTSLLIVNHRVPRTWSAEEVELVEDVAERTWNAVERVRAEAALRVLNHKLEDLLNERTAERDRLWDMAQDILAIASLDGYFLNCNPAMTAILGWTKREIQDIPFAEFAHPEQLKDLADVVAQLAAGVTVTGFEIRSRHKDGSYRWLSWNVVPQGKLLYLAGRDVTEEKKHRQALGQAEEALRQSQKMEAVGQLTGGIAHDFNNMLAGIVGNLELASFHLGAGRTDKLGQYLNGAEQAANRAATLTHRLLAFSRRQPLDPKPTDANALVISMQELISRTVGPAITVKTQLDSKKRMTWCDPHQLENALLNLVINSRDAMPEGGRLLIKTADVTPDDGKVPADGMASRESIGIQVIDTGCGMEPDIAARAFEPFYTTKPIGQGTGLGLSMVFGFVTQSEGQIRIDSAPGKGTSVTIGLPYYAGKACDSEVGMPASGIRSCPGQSVILLVDDEVTLREVLAEVIEASGHKVFQASDGAEALRLMKQLDQIDLLITDVGLPGGMNGRQLADAICASRPGLPVLFITGYAESSVFGKSAMEEGMHILVKPFSLANLSARVASLLK